MSEVDASLFRDNLEIFVGNATPAHAEVFVGLPAELSREGWGVGGKVVGPTCEYASTLMARVPLLACPGRGLWRQAVVPDPCFWTPELPYQYRVEITLTRGSEELVLAPQEIGIRPLAARGSTLLLAGKSWVLRGARRPSAAGLPLADWHAAEMALMVGQAGDESCAACSRLGVLLLVEIETGLSIQQELRRLARFPAVGVAVLPPGADLTEEAAAAGRRLLLAHRLIEPAGQLPRYAQIGLCSAAQAKSASQSPANDAMPFIVEQAADDSLTAEAARAACDKMQRDLAGFGQFAGYMA